MDLFDKKDWRKQISTLAREFIPRNETGRFWQDLLFLFLICSIQVSIIPSIFGANLVVDILTPWLVTSFVHQRVLPSLALGFFAALTMEYHSGTPAGFYICAYWLLITAIIQIRPTLSWRHKIPWVVSFILVEVWIICFEAFAAYLISDSIIRNPIFWCLQILRIPIATLFGLLICRKWLAIDAEEPVPQ